MHFLVAESETVEQLEARRRTAGCSSAESYIRTLQAIEPGAVCDVVRPHEADSGLARPLSSYDGVFLSGSPLHVYQDTAETRRQLEFMRNVFASETPSFGSCAGLQIAIAASGGEVARAPRHEVAFARRITATEAGQAHPMMAGRPPSWDALAIHSDVVTRLPPTATLLAGNAACPVQAAEIRFGGGVFWGVQYHPELTIDEIAAAMRRQASDVVDQGLCRTEQDVEQTAGLLDELHRQPDRRDLAWRFGVDEQVTCATARQRELANFIAMIHRASEGGSQQMGA